MAARKPSPEYDLWVRSQHTPRLYILAMGMGSVTLPEDLRDQIHRPVDGLPDGGGGDVGYGTDA